MKSPRLVPFLAVTIGLAWLPSALAEVKLPALFSDHAILQRDLPVPVWGTAEPGEDTVARIAAARARAREFAARRAESGNG